MNKAKAMVFDEECVECNEDIFTDCWFKKHMERIREQKEAGLALDMDKVKEYVEYFCPKESPLDFDQLCKDHGASTQIQVDQLVDMITILPSDVVLEGDLVSVDVLKGRSNTGRHSYQLLPDLPRSGKNYIPPKDGDLFIGGEIDTDLSRLEKLYQVGELVSEFQIVGKDPEQKPIKHPLIFKLADLVEDPQEFLRLEETLENNQKDREVKGFSMLPILVETAPDLTLSHDKVNNAMSRLVKLSGEYKVDIFLGPRTALKTVMYQYLYGGRQDDLPKDPGPIVLSGGGLFHDECLVIGASVAGKNTWKTPNTFRIESQTHGWDQGKLRRGKGHNKFKRKGKK